MTTDFRMDLLILLEDLPHSVAELATWLTADALTVARELRALEQLGVVTRQDDESGVRWALTGKPLPEGTPYRKPVKAKLRQPQPAAAETTPPAPSWWVGRSREDFSDTARQEFERRMVKQKLPHSLYPGQKAGM